ncbi:MAG: tRNA guanosine(34) transglycosylase Tgt [Candidatus Paceibacterota bacterium]
MEFEILKKSKISQARLGALQTSHGVVETPCLVPVATQAAIKTLTSEEVEQTQSQILIANTFHLHLKPGEEIVKAAGGLHKFMNWPRPLMTDSGGFQVFSLGFGRDFGTGKILKGKSDYSIKKGQQPKLLKIGNDGVVFTSPIDGRKIFLGPKESIKIQEALGADIIFAFDECTPPLADREYTEKSLLKTHRWAVQCLKAKNSKFKTQSLFGIVQGGKFRDLRKESAGFIGSLPFDGFGIGGEFGDNKKIMIEMIDWVIRKLPEAKPRHLLGIGRLEDITKIIKAGVDTFDCIVPTRYARHGIAFTSGGKLDFAKMKFLKDKKPLDKNCACFVCRNYRRNYINHLFRAGEITALKLLTFHNLYFFNGEIAKIRERIKKGKF